MIRSILNLNAGKLPCAAVAALLLLAGCARENQPARTEAQTTNPSPPQANELIDVTLGLNWFPEAEHGGYYAALVHGYYEQAGLRVKILPGGPGVKIMYQVAMGRAVFGVANADNVLFARAQRSPVVALMAPLQTSPRCLIVHQSSGIRSFEDLRNMKIAMSSGDAFSLWLRKKFPLEGVTVVPYSGTVALFLHDKNYAQQGYVFSEPYIAKQKGGDPKVLMLADIGFNPYTSLLFTTEDVLKHKKDLAQRMVAASLRGWQHYLDSPAETNAYIAQQNPQMTLDILDYGAKAIRPLVLTDEANRKGLGTMTRSRWQTLADQIVESDQLDRKKADVDGSFNTSCLPVNAARARPQQPSR
jgi:NitT/TauT family transport system substrate-binding protein